MSDDQTHIPILRTKQYKPPVVRDHLHRQGLLDLLNHEGVRPLTMISAPAGYGKSMLASIWLESCDMPNAWISLDENENDLRAFTAYFIAAVEGLYPGACRKTQILVNSPNLPQPGELISTLLIELNQIAQPFIIVLDDYHMIRETVVHDLMIELLKRPSRALHLVIICRQDPPMPLSTLRARGLVTEVRDRDLCLSRHETSEFLSMVLHQKIDPQTVAKLWEKTEGWITGLHLAAISLRHNDNPDPRLLEMHTDARYVMEFLFNEAFATQSEAIQKCLLKSAILDRFCASLCEAVCEAGTQVASNEPDGLEYISRLKQENLFLIPLDAGGRWFRFHHLFKKLLMDQLTSSYSSEAINALHVRASTWFADEGLITEAIRHALASGNEDGAVQLVVQHRKAALDAQRWFDLEKWLTMLPDNIIRKRPELLIAQVWIHYYQHNYRFIPSMLDAAESLLSHQPCEHQLYGEIYLFRSVFYLFQGNGELSFKFIKDALVLIPETQQFAYGIAESFLALAGQLNGKKEQVVNILTDLLHNQPLGDMRKSRVIYSLVLVYIISGDLSLAFTLSQQLEILAISTASSLYTAWSSYLSGIIHYCRNELDLAIIKLSKAVELKYSFLRRASVDSMAGLALTYQAAKLTDHASATLESLFEYAHSNRDPDVLRIANSCRTRLSLMKGEVPSSPDLTDINPTMGEEPMFLYIDVPVITHCRMLLEEGSDAALQEAGNQLQAILRLCRKQHNTFQMIFILPLLALVYEKRERPEEAESVLKEAVSLAEPGGFIRPFIEPGPDLIQPLKRLAEKNISENFIRQIMGLSEPLKDADSVIKAILESTGDISIFALDKDFRYLAFNQAHADEMMHLHGEKLWGGKEFRAFAEGKQGHKDLLRANCERVLKGERYTATEQREIGGKQYWHQSSYNPILNSGGEVIGLTCIIMNITERYQLIEQLKESKELADSANRAKSMFLANMSHELRTPLNVILGFSGMMAKGEEATIEQREKLSIINRSGRHLMSMINDVLDLSKIEAERIELNEDPFDLAALIGEICMMIRSRAAAKGIYLETETDSILYPYVVADISKLRQILINLLGNAVKFTDEGGVTIRGITEPVTEASNRCRIVIEVEDTGPGIDPEIQVKIFEPFVQGSDFTEQKGTGLGLSICKRYVEFMGGTIEVESKVGEGSLFRVVLPAKVASKMDLKTFDDDRLQVIGFVKTKKAWRILAVDDDRENLLLLKSMLEEVGLNVLEAESGREAVDVFKKELPDFIWMDMRMPVMDGYEAVRQIRELPEGKNVPISAITASVFREQRPDILAAGCDEVVYKPFQEHEIFEVMGRFLDIEYIYGREGKEEADLASQTLTPEMLTGLPDELLQELKEAIMSLDREAALEIISGIADKTPEAAGSLKYLVDNFRMTELRNLLEEVNKYADRK